MAKAYLFYNPLAGGGKILEDLDALAFVLDTQCVFCDMTRPETYGEALFAMEPEDALVLCGGDGTLNRFVNLTEGLRRNNEIYYYPAGEHNDFARDFGRVYGNNPFSITKALRDLPRVQTGNRSGSFLTGILFDACGRNRRNSTDAVGYNIPGTVSVTVDGEGHTYEKVCFGALMYGRHCAGGMIPDKGRRRTDGDLSFVLLHSCGKLRGRYLLRALRKGRQIRSRCLTIHRGRDIRLAFGAPVTLRIDGELQTDVLEASAAANREGEVAL